MTFSAYGEVKCDWLDVTFAPDNFPADEIRGLLHSVLGEVVPGSTAAKEKWRLDRGVVAIQVTPRWARLSASGLALDYLRGFGQFLSYLSIIGEQPHRVTRLDACLDVATPGADVVAALHAAYPASCALSRKAQGTKVIQSAGRDGRQTGTFYVGHKGNGDVAARVYDKQHQLWEVKGEEIGPLTRYEITVRAGMGPTLRDAAQPTRVFWHFAAPALLERPEGIEAWESGWGTGWEWSAPEQVPSQVLRRRVEVSAEIGRLIELSDAIGPYGREWLVKLIEERCGLRRVA